MENPFHEAQETTPFDQWKWLVLVAALFYLQMDLVHLLLVNRYGSENLDARLDRSQLRQHAEFCNCTKIRPRKFDFHAAELIIHSYKACMIAMFWIIVRKQRFLVE